MFDVTLQETIDELAGALGRPVSLEDRRLRLIAYSAHDGAADTVRTATILARQAPEAVERWVDELRLDRRGAVVEVPANEALGMVARLCAPVRHGRLLLGYLWLIDAGEPLGADAGRLLAATAQRLGALLYERRLLDEAGRRERTRALRTLVRDPMAQRRAVAADAVAAAQGWSEKQGFAALVARVGDDDGGNGGERLRLEAIGDRFRRRLAPRQAVHVAEREQLVAIVHVGAGGEDAVRRALRQLREAGADVAGAGSPRRALADAADAVREADRVCDVLGRVAALGREGLWSDLGGWGLLAALRAPGPPPELPACVRALVGSPNGEQLIQAAEAFLDHGGDVVAAARAIHVHRATLYRRVERVEQVAGVSLAGGEDRLVLHIGIRLWRLAGGRAAATAVAPGSTNL